MSDNHEGRASAHGDSESFGLAEELVDRWVREGSYPCLIPDDEKAVHAHMLDVLRDRESSLVVRIAVAIFSDTLATGSTEALLVAHECATVACDEVEPEMLRLSCLGVAITRGVLHRSHVRSLLWGDASPWQSLCALLIEVAPSVIKEECLAVLLSEPENISRQLEAVSVLKMLPSNMAPSSLAEVAVSTGISPSVRTLAFEQLSELAIDAKGYPDQLAQTSNWIGGAVASVENVLFDPSSNGELRTAAVLFLRNATYEVSFLADEVSRLVCRVLPFVQPTFEADYLFDIVEELKLSSTSLQLLDIATCQDADPRIRDRAFECLEMFALCDLECLPMPRYIHHILSIALCNSNDKWLRSMATRVAVQYLSMLPLEDVSRLAKASFDDNLSGYARMKILSALESHPEGMWDDVFLYHALSTKDDIDTSNLRRMARQWLLDHSAHGVSQLTEIVQNDDRVSSGRHAALHVLLVGRCLEADDSTKLLRDATDAPNLLIDLLHCPDCCVSLATLGDWASIAARQHIESRLLHLLAHTHVMYKDVHVSEGGVTLNEAWLRLYRTVRQPLENAECDNFRMLLVQCIAQRCVSPKQRRLSSELQDVLFHPHCVRELQSKWEHFWKRKVKDELPSTAFSAMLPELVTSLGLEYPFHSTLESEDELYESFLKCTTRILWKVAKRAQRERRFTTARDVFTVDLQSIDETPGRSSAQPSSEIDEAISQLDAATADIVRDVYLEGHTQKEIAMRLGICEKSVSRKLNEARRTLAAYFSK